MYGQLFVKNSTEAHYRCMDDEIGCSVQAHNALIERCGLLDGSFWLCEKLIGSEESHRQAMNGCSHNSLTEKPFFWLHLAIFEGYSQAKKEE